MAKEALFDPLKIQGGAVRRMAGELPPASAAADYDAEVKTIMAERKPAFDLVLLGMGRRAIPPLFSRGHRRSDDQPHRRCRDRADRAARAPDDDPGGACRQQILFLVTGKEKAQALAKIFGGSDDLPAARVAQLAPSRFLVDEAAASQLPT